jgi:hypothetical protein
MLLPAAVVQIKWFNKKTSKMEIQQKIIDTNSIFENGYMDGKVLFMYCFGKLPSANYINNIDGQKAFAAIQSKFGYLIKSIHAYRYYERNKRKYAFDETFIIMNNGCIVAENKMILYRLVQIWFMHLKKSNEESRLK